VCVGPSTATSTTQQGSGGSNTGGGTNTGGGNSGGGNTGGSGGDPDASVDPMWGCLGHVVMEQPQKPMVMVSLPFFDLIRMMPFPTGGVKAGPKLDVTCSRPIAPAVAANMEGIATFQVPALFDGYGQVIDLQGPDGGDGDAGSGASDGGAESGSNGR